jgi:hypothetical protein
MLKLVVQHCHTTCQQCTHGSLTLCWQFFSAVSLFPLCTPFVPFIIVDLIGCSKTRLTFYLGELPWLEACWNTEISAGWEKRLKSCTVYLMQRNTTLLSHDVWHQRRIRFYFNLTECWTLSSILFMRKGMYWVGDLWAVDGGSLLLHQSFICFF